MRSLITGGACNVDQNQQGMQRNMNPFMGLMDKMFTGNAQNMQKMEGFRPEGNNGDGNMLDQQMQQRQLQMMQMNDQWNTLEKEFKEKQFIDEGMKRQFEESFQQEQMAYQQMMEFQKQQMQQQWQFHQEQANLQEWNQQFAMEQNFEKALLQEDLQQFSKEFEQQKINDASNEMFDMMSKDDDPRFKNSQFLNFLGKLKSKELIIEGKQLIQNSGTVNLEQQWDNAQKAQEVSEQKQMESTFQQAQEEQAKQQQKFEDMWAQRIKDYEEETKLGEEDEENFAKILEQQYKQVLETMKDQEGMEQFMMNDAWEKAADLEEFEMYRDASDRYIFKKENPYLSHSNPYELGLDLIAQGNSYEAIMALEAALQKDPQNFQNGEVWRIMGRLHQENDIDNKAVTCLLNSLKYDDKNLDTLLQLGISCTNILDEIKAMNFLKLWLLNNPKYAHLKVDPMIVPSDEQNQFTIPQIKEINMRMIDAFERARISHSEDPELYNALAILHFIARDYEKGVISFKEALNLDPTNYSLWNKMGATLAHLGKADEALEVYHRALDIKPNYVRVWVNLGIAHAYKGEYQVAAQYYLNSLSFNPDAKHIWTYLHTCFSCMARFDLLQKIMHHDVNAFSGDFEILKISDLPQPSINYKDTSLNVVIKDAIHKK